MSQSALAEVGLTDPGGDPAALYHNAQCWADISAYLSDHSTRIAELTAAGLRNWEGDAANAFAARGTSLAQNASVAAYTTAAVAAEQQQHAQTHEMVKQIIIELSIQIATMLAFYAAAALFPALLAWAQAWLTYLIATGVRVLRMLAQALNTLVRFLIQARTWINGVAELTWNTPRFSLGYGRMITEGIRDIAIDLTANLVAAGIQHKKVDPAQLFISAGISGGIGGIVGGLEKTGVRKALDEAGNVKRGADGLPEFVPLGKQAQNFVKEAGSPPRPRPEAPPPSRATELLANAKNSYDDARNLGLKGAPGENHRLADDLAATRNRYDTALTRHTEANDNVRRLGDDVWTREQTVRSYRNAVDQADLRFRSAETKVSLYRSSGNPSWVDESIRELADARAELTAATQGLRTAEDSLSTSRRNLSDAERTAARANDEAEAAEAAHRLARDRANAWIRHDAARDAARAQTTFGEQFQFVRRNNEWTDSFGDPKWWQEIVFYDVPKDAVKGAANGAVKSAVEVARGNGQSGDIWKDALLGGATGAVRGGVNSVGSNRAFPAGGIEETLWKTGSKTMDDYARREIKEATYGKP
ncbi:hypothetical protein [Kibdelosporangium phytohabitans]|uniref:Uncharacterized protein n=1 Tax=Kibdelosporangium phytohabitans TaxID=860235 RepID=A0A0N9HXW0_9PSEU|nr:hypothetical protein [Kibdelosporangium phytohabitans]ALG08395.1 hypothetical protein AOZ06_17080 [Kibdelosporangium phytohabitans]MBE1470557.1 hypothetical protein [Kibdelosporangium phytohabitans]